MKNRYENEYQFKPINESKSNVVSNKRNTIDKMKKK